jgi:hypothetical protein
VFLAGSTASESLAIHLASSPALTHSPSIQPKAPYQTPPHSAHLSTDKRGGRKVGRFKQNSVFAKWSLTFSPASLRCSLSACTISPTLELHHTQGNRLSTEAHPILRSLPRPCAGDTHCLIVCLQMLTTSHSQAHSACFTNVYSQWQHAAACNPSCFWKRRRVLASWSSHISRAIDT